MMEIIKNYRDDPKLRASFNKLAGQTFGLNFENWYQNGFWGEKYIPYSVVLDGEVAANVSVNLIDGTLCDKQRHYIQLGTVMTRPDCRLRGYSAMLMDAVERDFGHRGAFLYANDTVLDFYPKFGFGKMAEYRYSADVTGGEMLARPVEMNNMTQWQMFLQQLRLCRPMGVFKPDTEGLFMFYLTQFMNDTVYHIENSDAYAVAEIENGVLTLYEVFSKSPVELAAILHSFGDVSRAELAFTPEDVTGLERRFYHEKDSTFFARGDGLARDMGTIESFPQLIHA